MLCDNCVRIRNAAGPGGTDAHTEHQHEPEPEDFRVPVRVILDTIFTWPGRGKKVLSDILMGTGEKELGKRYALDLGGNAKHKLLFGAWKRLPQFAEKEHKIQPPKKEVEPTSATYASSSSKLCSKELELFGRSRDLASDFIDLLSRKGFVHREAKTFQPMDNKFNEDHHDGKSPSAALPVTIAFEGHTLTDDGRRLLQLLVTAGADGSCGKKPLDLGSTCSFLPPRRLMELREEKHRRRVAIQKEVKTEGFDVSRVPAQELDKGEGKTLEAELKWQRFLAKIRGAGVVEINAKNAEATNASLLREMFAHDAIGDKNASEKHSFEALSAKLAAWQRDVWAPFFSRAAADGVVLLKKGAGMVTGNGAPGAGGGDAHSGPSLHRPLPLLSSWLTKMKISGQGTSSGPTARSPARASGKTVLLAKLSDTVRESVELFLQGFDIDLVAVKRVKQIAPSTVEGHLLSAFSTTGGVVFLDCANDAKPMERIAEKCFPTLSEWQSMEHVIEACGSQVDWKNGKDWKILVDKLKEQRGGADPQYSEPELLEWLRVADDLIARVPSLTLNDAVITLRSFYVCEVDDANLVHALVGRIRSLRAAILGGFAGWWRECQLILETGRESASANHEGRRKIVDCLVTLISPLSTESNPTTTLRSSIAKTLARCVSTKAFSFAALRKFRKALSAISCSSMAEASYYGDWIRVCEAREAAVLAAMPLDELAGELQKEVQAAKSRTKSSWDKRPSSATVAYLKAMLVNRLEVKNEKGQQAVRGHEGVCTLTEEELDRFRKRFEPPDEVRASPKHNAGVRQHRPAVIANSEKHTILRCACVCLFVQNYSYDCPTGLYSALKPYMVENTNTVTDQRTTDASAAASDSNSEAFLRSLRPGDSVYNLLYSFYSIPNMVLPLFSGFLLNTEGSSSTSLRPLIMFLRYASLWLTAAATLIYYAVWLKSWTGMWLGRLLFGIASEISFVAWNVLIMAVFTARGGTARCANKSSTSASAPADEAPPSSTSSMGPTFAMACVCCVSRLGTSASCFVGPWLCALALEPSLVFAIGAGFSACGTLFAGEEVDEGNMESHLHQDNLHMNVHSGINIDETETGSAFSPIKARKGSKNFSSRRTPSRGSNRNRVEEPARRQHRLKSSRAATACRNDLKLLGRNVARLPHEFWVFAVVCVSLSGAIFPFNNVAQDVIAKIFYRDAEADASVVAPESPASRRSRSASAGAAPASESFEARITELLAATAPPSRTSGGSRTNAAMIPAEEGTGSGISSEHSAMTVFPSEQSEGQHLSGNAKAGRDLALIFLVSGLLTPLAGRIVDKSGGKHTLHFATCSLLVCGQTMFGAVLWPSVATVLGSDAESTSDLLSTAYGVATALQNTALVVVPIAVGKLMTGEDDSHFSRDAGASEALAAAATAAKKLEPEYLKVAKMHHGRGDLETAHLYHSAEFLFLFLTTVALIASLFLVPASDFVLLREAIKHWSQRALLYLHFWRTRFGVVGGCGKMKQGVSCFGVQILGAGGPLSFVAGSRGGGGKVDEDLDPENFTSPPSISPGADELEDIYSASWL
eukprot:g2650.t1